MRIFLLSVLTMAMILVVLQAALQEHNDVLPQFLRADEIADGKQVDLNIEVTSRFRPNKQELQVLIKDYTRLWAHLNHLYATNDVIAGKEFYTEAWFKQIVSHYKGKIASGIQRTDKKHHLTIQNWSSDGLVCTAVDSNLVLQYSFPGEVVEEKKVHVALLLLFQGDHWRIDAMHVSEPEF